MKLVHGCPWLNFGEITPSAWGFNEQDLNQEASDFKPGAPISSSTSPVNYK